MQSKQRHRLLFPSGHAAPGNGMRTTIEAHPQAGNLQGILLQTYGPRFYGIGFSTATAETFADAARMIDTQDTP